jgi:hypothetical protein
MMGNRVYRSTSTRWLGATFAFAFILVFITGFNGVGGGKTGSSVIVVISVFVMTFAALGFVWSVFYFAQMGVATSDNGILIRNWFRRRFVLWPEVQEFKFGNDVNNLSVREGLASPYLQTYAVTKDGHHYVMCGLTATRLNRTESRHRVQQLLNQLEEERLSHLG